MVPFEEVLAQVRGALRNATPSLIHDLLKELMDAQVFSRPYYLSLIPAGDEEEWDRRDIVSVNEEDLARRLALPVWQKWDVCEDILATLFKPMLDYGPKEFPSVCDFPKDLETILDEASLSLFEEFLVDCNFFNEDLNVHDDPAVTQALPEIDSSRLEKRKHEGVQADTYPEKVPRLEHNKMEGGFHLSQDPVPCVLQLTMPPIPVTESASLLPSCGECTVVNVERFQFVDRCMPTSLSLCDPSNVFYIPDGPAFQVIHTLPHSVINFPVASTIVPVSNYVLMSPVSVSPGSQIVPVSPVGGTVAPTEFNVTAPVSSQTDSASKGLYSPSVSPRKAADEIQQRDTPASVPQPPRKPSPEMPRCVEDYIQLAKSQMKDSCGLVEPNMSMESHYVDVQLVQRRIQIKTGKNANKCLEKELVVLSDSERKEATIDRSQVFRDSSSKPKQLMAILGKAGMGKSVLIRRLCLDWANDCLPQFKFVFLLNFKTLSRTQSSHSLRSLLFDLSSAPGSENTEDVFKYILSSPAEVLIIFDSFDDFRDYTGLLHCPDTYDLDSNYSIKDLFSGLFQKKLLAGCTLLIATRPKGVLNQLLRKVDSILELCGFTSEEIQLYTSNYFRDSTFCEKALAAIKSQSYVFSLCSCPLLCRITCSLLENQDCAGFTLPSTLTGLCKRLLHQILNKNSVKDKQTQNILRLCGLAWEAFKTQNVLLNSRQSGSEELWDFGLNSGILTSHITRKENGEEQTSYSFAHLLIQNLLCVLHMAQSKDISDKMLVAQIMLQQKKKKPQGEWHDGMQRFVTGLLFQKTSSQDGSFLETTADTQAKRKAVEAHLESLRPGQLIPTYLLELFHCVYESNNVKLSKHLVKSLPDDLSFYGTQLCPPDIYVVRHVLQNAKGLRRTFSINLQDTSISLSGLKDLVGLNCIKSFRASIADTISLWEDLHKNNDAALLKSTVDKFTICPYKATEVRHIDNLFHLVQIHKERKLSLCGAGPALEDDIPAVRHLQKLEYELGPQHGPVAFPRLVAILPTLQSLQYLDLENNKIGDSGAELLADVLLNLSSLKILNLSQNYIGDKGVEKLALALSSVLSLQSLSLYSNFIADGGAESLASVLPNMKSLMDLDVKYNKFTDIGAQKLGDALKNCPSIKALELWNQFIPYGVFEHLQHQDTRIGFL
ncbi:MHC class II transactivator [Chanos chanos]|uniref:MHC class II transactivator n=1 Tax=Chanos chanos TaxID=29144 RepID=A0A6J2WJB1_CHACN|nr:MHC class II transactivator [Chanos chanos]